MPNSLRSKLSKLRYKRHITEDEYRELIEKLNGHDKELLDKIKAEIEALPKTYPFINHFDTYVKEDDVKKIIDKYRESEVKA